MTMMVRVYIAGFVHKFFNALQSVGDDRAKERKSRAEYMTSKLCQLEAEIRAREAAEAAAGEVSDR